MAQVVPLYAGEFGLEIRFRVPKVYAMGAVPVEIESGKEALYPRASEWIIRERTPEDTPEASRKRGGKGRPKLSGPEERFIPEPHVPQGVPPADVVVCPRKRHYVSEKNWDQWPRVVDQLKQWGLSVFAGGVADASDTRVDCDAAWEYGRPLDACIEAMHSAKVVVANCSGLCHLAVLCGADLLVVTYRGLDAPGPVINSAGRKMADKRWPVRMEEYYHSVNHAGARIESMDGWEYPERVVEEIAAWVG